MPSTSPSGSIQRRDRHEDGRGSGGPPRTRRGPAGPPQRRRRRGAPSAGGGCVAWAAVSAAPRTGRRRGRRARRSGTARDGAGGRVGSRGGSVEPGLEHHGGSHLVDDATASLAREAERGKRPVGGHRRETLIVGLDGDTQKIAQRLGFGGGGSRGRAHASVE